MVASGGVFDTMNENLEITNTCEIFQNVNRLVCVGDSFFFSTVTGSIGFVRERTPEIILEKKSGAAIDSDIHSSGHLAAVLSEGSFELIDPTRGTVVGQVPVGATGRGNGLRIVDSSLVAVASSVVSLFDVRTPQCKQGIPSFVLPGKGGRTFTCLDSDSMHWLVGGDSEGQVVLWDARAPGTVVKAVHAHAGAVLASSINGGLVGSTSTDGSVALWTVDSGRKKKKSRKHAVLAEMTSETLNRTAVEGGGAGLGICVEEEGKRVVYVTDTGLVCTM